jgi:hypothetical protein
MCGWYSEKPRPATLRPGKREKCPDTPWRDSQIIFEELFRADELPKAVDAFQQQVLNVQTWAEIAELKEPSYSTCFWIMTDIFRSMPTLPTARNTWSRLPERSLCPPALSSPWTLLLEHPNHITRGPNKYHVCGPAQDRGNLESTNNSVTLSRCTDASI